MNFPLENLEKILREKSGNPSSLFSYGEKAFQQGKNLIALSFFQKLLEMEPDSMKAHLGLAKVYFSQKIYSEAYRELEEVLKRKPDHVEGRVLASILSKEPDPPGSFLSTLKSSQATSLNPEEIQEYLKALKTEEENLADRIRKFSELLETSPLDTLAEYDKNMAFRRLQELEKLSVIARQFLKDSTPSQEKSKARLHLVSKKEPHEKGGEKSSLLELQEILEPVMKNLKQTEGIQAVFLLNGNGGIMVSLSEEKHNLEEFSLLLEEGFKTLKQFADFLYWVIELKHGILAIRRVASSCFLSVFADSTIRFSTLYFMLDKTHLFSQEEARKIENF